MKIIVELSSFLIGSDGTSEVSLSDEFDVDEFLLNELLESQAEIAARIEFEHGVNVELYGHSIDFETEELGFAITSGVSTKDELEEIFETIKESLISD
jgi:hypothetical protein